MEDWRTIAFDEDYDHITNKVYGSYWAKDGSGTIFGYREPGTFNTVEICASPQYNAVAVSSDGTVFAIDMEGKLFTINKETGVPTEIGSTGVVPYYISSATIDKKTDIMYWTVCDANDQGSLYSVDLKTAKASLVCHFKGNEEVTGLFIPDPPAKNGAPYYVSDFNMNTRGTSRTVDITFSMPSNYFDEDAEDYKGNILTGELTYTIERDNQTIATGKASAGEYITYTDEVPENRIYEYIAYASNTVGEGPKSKASMFIGSDIPYTPEFTSFNYSDDVFEISWTPISQEGINGGNLSSQVTYTVCMYKNNEIAEIFKGLTSTEFSKTVEIPDSITFYSFSLQAVTTDETSGVVYTPSYALGNVYAPYHEDFETDEYNSIYTVIDANNDDYKWEFMGGEAQIGCSREAMNDWLITPGIVLKGGLLYTFYFGTRAGSSDWKERVEVKMGNTNTIEAMNQTLIEPVSPPSETKEYTATFIPEKDGMYYFGIHGCSDADQFRLCVDYLGISKGLSSEAPAAPSDVKAIPAADGTLSAEISYVAPSKNIAGEETILTKIELYRNGELISTQDNPIGGKTYSYTDYVPNEGKYTYEVIAYNTVSEGPSTKVSIFIGTNIPSSPLNATVEETDKEGEVLITWEAPVTDMDGYPLNSSDMTYSIIDPMQINDEGAYVTIAEDLEETNFRYQAMPEGQQGFVQYFIYAKNKAGESYPVSTPMIVVRTPYTLPFFESFDNGNITNPFGSENINGTAEWQPRTNADFVNLQDFDNTNGFVSMTGGYAGDKGALYTGKIKLDSDNPCLSFAYYVPSPENQNTIEIGVKTKDMETPEIVRNITMNNGNSEWIYEMVDLKKYKGQTVQIYFIATAVNYINSMFDAFRISQTEDYDLMASSIISPERAKVNVEYNVNIQIGNIGTKDVDSYTVELICNGTVVKTIECEALASGEFANFTVPQTLTVTSPEENIYSARVTCEHDAIMDNNTTAETVTRLMMPDYPKADNLKATTDGSVVTLQWDAPNLTENRMFTEDFEDYEPFTTKDLGEWTLVDEDNYPSGGWEGINIPGIIPGETAFAYYVMNTEVLGMPEDYKAHSGVQYLIANWNVDGVQSLDWLISPKLSGEAQNISFFVRAITSQYGYEEFRVLYSTTDNDIKSFTEIKYVNDTPDTWTEYNIELPEGATYFAIQYVSTDKFMLCIDDITFEASPIQVTLNGYNIYRNGTRVNDTPVSETTYKDYEGKENDEYIVTAVYKEGESAPSNKVMVTGSDLDQNKVDIAHIEVVNSSIMVTGAKEIVTVYTIDGIMVYRKPAEKCNIINASPGVYIVDAGNRIEKVIVR